MALVSSGMLSDCDELASDIGRRTPQYPTSMLSAPNKICKDYRPTPNRRRPFDRAIDETEWTKYLSYEPRARKRYAHRKEERLHPSAYRQRLEVKSAIDEITGRDCMYSYHNYIPRKYRESACAPESAMDCSSTLLSTILFCLKKKEESCEEKNTDEDAAATFRKEPARYEKKTADGDTAGPSKREPARYEQKMADRDAVTTLRKEPAGHGKKVATRDAVTASSKEPETHETTPIKQKPLLPASTAQAPRRTRDADYRPPVPPESDESRDSAASNIVVATRGSKPLAPKVTVLRNAASTSLNTKPADSAQAEERKKKRAGLAIMSLERDVKRVGKISGGSEEHQDKREAMVAAKLHFGMDHGEEYAVWKYRTMEELS